MDVVASLCEAIKERKHDTYYIWTKLIGAACGCGFNGKLGLIDKMFSKHNTEDVNKDQYLMETKAVWVKLGKDPEEFERLVKENKPIVI